LVGQTALLWELALALLANAAGAASDAMQTVRNRLVVYACSKHLTIDTAKSAVVHFNSAVIRCSFSC